jgi:hypothetical protein
MLGPLVHGTIQYNTVQYSIVQCSAVPYNTINVNVNHWVMHPVARVSTIIVETSVRNKCRCSFYCALFTLHVSAPIGGHIQVKFVVYGGFYNIS